MRVIRGFLGTCLVVLLFSVSACSGSSAASASGGATLRANQDRYLDPRWAIRPIETPATLQPSKSTTIVSPAAQSLLLSAPDRLVSADGLGVYADCSGNSPIDTAKADIDPCFLGRTYFVGHSPGVFSPLLHMGVDSLITWYDAVGLAHPLRVVSERDFGRNSRTLQLSQPDVVAQFQTCLTNDGSMDRILDAIPA